MVKLVIFDLDGTLVNSIADIAYAVNEVLKKNDYPTHPLSAFNNFVGNGAEMLIKRALPEDTHPVEVDRMIEKFKIFYTLHANENTLVYDGILPLLNKLKERGIMIAVASNKYHSATVDVVKHYFGDNIFNMVEGKRDGVEPKPDPTIVNKIIKSLNIKHNEVLYVGDSGVDMQTAKNAGIISAGVEWGYRTREELTQSGANYIVSNPYEIEKLLS